MPEETILVQEETGVVTITLNRPEKHNATTLEMSKRLTEELRAADASDDVRCIVVRGAGPSFSSGSDLAAEASPSAEGNPWQDREPTLREDIHHWDLNEFTYFGEPWSVSLLQTPVIAQVHGYCLAAALDFASNCDLLVAAEDAKIGYPIVRNIGTPPTHMFTYLMGPQWTRYMLYTGDLIDGKKAAEIGLALFSVPGEQLDRAVSDLAHRIAGVPKDLLYVHKRVCNKALNLMGRLAMQDLAREANAMSHLTLMRAFNQARKQGGEGWESALADMQDS